MILYRLFCLTMVFPFTKLIPLNAYNQPYGLILAAFILMMRPQIFRLIPRNDQWVLNSIALMGTMGLLLAIPQGLQFREISFWISYISPFLMVPVAFWIVIYHHDLLKRILTVGIYIWLAVAVVQLLVSPSFLTFLVSTRSELGLNILNSGRGVLGLAPEPTHHGFQILILAACLALMGGSRVAIIVALIAVIVLARSSSALLSLGVGGLIWMFMRPLQRGPLILIVLGSIAFVGTVSTYLGDSYRITRLLNILIETRGDIIFYDASVNMRLFGMIAPLIFVFENAFVPMGISIDAWLVTRETILTNNPLIFNLSYNGPASGFGLFLLQMGVFAIVPVIIMLKRLTWDNRMSLAGSLTCAVAMAFMGQLYLAAPSFSLIYALAIWRTSQAPLPS